MSTNQRRRTAIVSLLSLLLGLVTAVAAMAQEGVRTTAEGIQGYSLSSEAAPSGIEFFEQAIPVPVDPGEPQFEITESFTTTRLDVGPTGRAVASSIWPGAGLGDGFAAVCECDQSYPIKAQANFPGDTTRQSQEAPNGGGMTAVAEGLDVVAQADASDTPVPELLTFGSVSSQSESHVLDGEVIATATSSMGDASLLAGVITIDSVVTEIGARSDTQTATTGGDTTVNGLTIMGQGYTIDEDGLQAVTPPPEEDDEESEEPSPGGILGDVAESLPDVVSVLNGVLGADALREEVGISVQLVEHAEELAGANGQRVAEGLRIIVETGPLRSALNALPLADLVTMVPDPEAQAQLFFLIGLRPRIDFVIAAGSVRAAATAPFAAAAPPPPPPLPPPPAAPATTAPAAPTSSSPPVASSGTTNVGSSGFTGSSGSVGTSSAPAPVTAAPPAVTAEPAPQAAPAAVPLAGPQLPELFTGLSPVLGVLAALFVLGGAYGLSGLTESAMVATATGAADGCALTNRDLSDLRATA